eukprot:scaffold735_cov255-Pinguiococcus_pyrenoidosus.AAC.4
MAQVARLAASSIPAAQAESPGPGPGKDVKEAQRLARLGDMLLVHRYLRGHRIHVFRRVVARVLDMDGTCGRLSQGFLRSCLDNAASSACGTFPFKVRPNWAMFIFWRQRWCSQKN